MRQRAVVKETNGKTATVEVSRSTMCDGCIKGKKCGGHCEITGLITVGDNKMTSRAVNRIGASVGDTVEVEAAESTVLGYAALVFILPIAVCALLYYIAERISGSTVYGIIGGIAGFILTFAGIAVFDRMTAKKAPQIEIVGIVSQNTIESSE